jgi:hypothetical protein
MSHQNGESCAAVIVSVAGFHPPSASVTEPANLAVTRRAGCARPAERLTFTVGPEMVERVSIMGKWRW